MPLRMKVSLELGTIALLTAVFLFLFPHRNPLVDVALAGCALFGIGASARYTRNVIWIAAAPQPPPDARRRCVKMVLWITVPVVFLFLLIGGVLAYNQRGWSGVVDRVLHWKLVASFGGYLIWALMQQTLHTSCWLETGQRARPGSRGKSEGHPGDQESGSVLPV